jgi:hypothetical protein
MLQSIIVYGITLIMLLTLGLIAAKRERVNNTIRRKNSFFTPEIFFSLLIFAVISGIRWNVGVDHLSYLSSYETIKAGGEFRASGVEQAFDLITRLFAVFDVHFTLYFAFWAFLQLFFIYYAFKDEKYLLPFICVVLILGPHYLNWMNGIRQTLAACMFVYSVQFIKDTKFFKYLITILLATLIHKTAILLLALYFIPQKDYFRNRLFTFGLLILSVFIGSTPLWLNFIDNFVAVFNFLGYDEYIQQLDIFVENERNLAFGPRRIILFIITSLIILYSKKLKKHFENTNFLMFFNFSIFGEIYFNFFAGANHIFRRPATYFTIFTIITTAYLLYYLKLKSKGAVSLKFIIILVLLIFYLLISCYAEYPKGDYDFTNFKFFWDYI